MRVIARQRNTSGGRVRCNACYDIIPKGTRYETQTVTDETHLWSWKTCPECEKMTVDVCGSLYFSDDGVTDLDYAYWAEDHPDDPRAQDYKKRRHHATTTN